MNKSALTLSLLISVFASQAQENCQVFTGDVSFTESVFNGTVIINPAGPINVGSQYNKPEEKLELIYDYIEFQLEQIDDPAVAGMDLSDRLDYLQRKEQKIAEEKAQIEANRKELVVQEKRVKDIEQKFQANIDAESRRIESLVSRNADKLAKDPLIKEKVEQKLAQKDRIVESTKACLLNNFTIVPLQDAATGNISYGFSLDEIRRDPNYVLIDDYHEGMARVRRNNKFGFFDKQGQLAIPFKYDYAEAFAGGRALVQNLGKWFLIDKSGQIIISLSEQNELSRPVKITTICPNVYAYGHSATGPSSDKFFYYGQGDIVKWNEISPFNENSIAFFEIEKWHTKDKYFGIVDKKGQIILAAEYKKIEASKAYPGYYLISKSYNETGMIDSFGQIKLPARFSNIKDYDFWDFPKYDLVVAGLDSKSNGLFHLSGKQILAPEYSDINLKDNFIIVQKDGKSGLFTIEGEPVLDIQYNNLNIKYNRIELEQDSLWGFATLEGKVLVPPRYQKISDYKTGKLLQVQAKDGLYGVIDQQGNEVLPTQFKYLNIFYSLKLIVARAKEGKEKAVFDIKGKQISPWQDLEVLLAHSSSGKVTSGYAFDFIPDHVFLQSKKTGELFFMDANLEFKSLGAFRQYGINKFQILGHKTYFIGDNYGNIHFFNEQYILSKKYYVPKDFIPKSADQNGNIILSGKQSENRDLYLINNKFEKISDEYDVIKSCANGMYMVKKHDKIGFLDTQGQPVTRIRFHSAFPYRADNFAIVSTAPDQYGIIDQYGAVLVVPVFSKIDKTKNGYNLHDGKKNYTLDESLQCIFSNCEEYQEIVKIYNQQKQE